MGPDQHLRESGIQPQVAENRSWLARLSQALRIPILRISIADYFTGESHLGIVLQEQRSAFQKARNLAAVHGFCLMFIDEIDALPSRASLAADSRASHFYIPIVNDALLLVEQARKDFVILCAATNRRDALDAALLRPGRFDKVIGDRPAELAGHDQRHALPPRGRPA